MIELVIFDCDGVLFDSWRANVAFYDAVLARMDLPALSPEWERKAHTMASAQLFEALFAGDPENEARAVGISRALDYTPFYRLMEPMPALREVLAELAGRHRLALASNRGRTVHGVLREFGLVRWIELAVGVHDVERPKPHPDLLEHCLRHFDTRPERAVYVGDADTDRQAAEAAGVHFIAVGAHCEAEVMVRELREVPGAIRGLASIRR